VEGRAREVKAGGGDYCVGQWRGEQGRRRQEGETIVWNSGGEGKGGEGRRGRL